MTAIAVARPKALAFAVLGAGIVGAVVLHLLAGSTFPVSWPDEIDFLTPAANLARHGTFSAPELNAPDGMFWVPDFYYLLLAPVLRVLPVSVEAARAFSLFAVLAAGIGFWVAGTRAGAGRLVSAFVVGAWLVTPSAVLTGNIARQEAPVLAFVAWSVAATVMRRRTLALAFAGLAALTHPAGVAFLVVAVAANAPLKRGDERPLRATRRWEWVVAGIALAIAAFQVAHLVMHLDVALDQLQFQLNRKANRDPRVPTSLAFLLFGLVVVAVWHWRRDRRVVFGGALVALAVVCTVGQEMWYGIYGWPTGLMLAALAAAASIDWRSLSAPTRRVAPVLVCAAVAMVVAEGWTSDFYGMRFGEQPDEWKTFVSAVHAQLIELSESSDEEQVVLINDLSGLPWPLESDRVGNVRLVKETSTTLLNTTTPRLQLYARTVCCNPHGPIPAGKIISKVSSPNEVYDATLLIRRFPKQRIAYY